MAIRIDTNHAEGKVLVVDGKGDKSEILLVCGGDENNAVREHAQSNRAGWVLGLYGNALKLDVSALPSGRQVFEISPFVKQAAGSITERKRTVALTPETAGEWGWYGSPLRRQPPPSAPSDTVST
jgi:hypothetical protein